MVVHAAHIHDSKGAKPVLQRLFKKVTTLKRLWADQGYRGDLGHWVKEQFACELEVVKKKKAKGFHILPRRWVVERTFAWLSRYRRLNREYEKNPISSEAMVYVSSVRLLLNKLRESVKIFTDEPNALANVVSV